MLNILIIIPILAAGFAALFMEKRPRLIKYAALLGSIASLALIIISYYSPSALQSMSWFNFLGYAFPITTTTAPLNMLLLLIMGVMTPLIIAYSIGFMNVPSEQRRYYFELCMFAAAMMLFAMAGDFITMFIGWELLGITSYLLIGFWYKRDGTPAAARKAITTILIGDIMMFLAMIVIWNSYHTFVFANLLQRAGMPNPAIAIALVLIIIAAFTKSAQFPFHEWLPDAMKGPTPVSAYLHSSTMVKAGVFLVAVLLPLFAAYHLLYLLLIFGLITAVLGAANALAERQIKRILAYSTIEDLGLMFVALGTGSLLAAMMLFVVQTFYKALLFMSAGSIMMANSYEEDMQKMYNSPSYLHLFVPTVIGVASLAGLFPLSGFFGKTAVNLSTNNIIVYMLLLVIAFISNLYIFRWLFLPLREKNYRKSAQSRMNYKTLPYSMTIAMYVLAVLIIAASAAYIYLPPYLGQYGIRPFAVRKTDVIVSVAISLIAIAASYIIFYRKNLQLDEQGLAYKTLYSSVIVNSAYTYLTKLFVAASAIMEELDHSLYSIIRGGGTGVLAFGNMAKKLENGDPNTYIAAFVIGLIIIVAIFAL